ncbi:MAG: 23S rRNA (guanosine(2251)-2'-O)-methyltransferase RlmB [Cyanobacteriota bacterium]|nr:23S rRNA (guanosine(2251)-2'-O)-methyltransferase RlmB [Cyanobacteriota bacterium]
MSPRFERRPDRRAASGGARSVTPGVRRLQPGRRPRSDGPRDVVREGPGDRSGDRPRSSADSRVPERRFNGGRERPAGRRSSGSRPSGPPASPRRRIIPVGRSLPVNAASEALPAEAQRFGQEIAPDMLWGRHTALAALEAGRPIHRIWCTPELRFSPRFLQLLRDAKGSGVLVEEVSWARLGQISGGAVHQGIVLQTAAADTLDLDTLISGCRQLGEPALLMAVDGLTDPQNLGAIVRSAEALGAHGLVLPQRRNAGLTGTVAKVAAGALEALPVARVVNLNRSLDALKKEGFRVIGLAAEGSVTLEEVDLVGPLVVVTGSEGEGLSMLTRRSCDQLVRIPLRGATPSLNASVATALLLYEIARRSWMRGISGAQPAPRISRPTLLMPAAQPDAQPEPQEFLPPESPVAPRQEDSSIAPMEPAPASSMQFEGDIQL